MYRLRSNLRGADLCLQSNTQRTTQTRQTVPPAQSMGIEREVSTQQRINRYFHGDVMSKLTSCWSNVQGKGTISLKYIYTKSGEKWIFNHLETDHSTLPNGQDAIAMKCMLDAVHGSSFAPDVAELTRNTFVLYWTWPVPFPRNASQLTTAMFAATTGLSSRRSGCDGQGTAAKCNNCRSTSCAKVCVGYNTCSVDSDGICLASGGVCATGGPFGVSGSSIIY